jgi:hypothetical protein
LDLLARRWGRRGREGKGMNEWMMIEDMLWLVLWIDE